MAKKTFSKEVKKKAKRNSVPFANLQKRFHNLNIHEWIDFDYVPELISVYKTHADPAKREEALNTLLYLDKFVEEEYRAYFNKDKKHHINKKSNRRAIYGNNNARNVDVYARAKGKKELDFSSSDVLSEALEQNNNYLSPEDAMIDMLDNRKNFNPEDHVVDWDEVARMREPKSKKKARKKRTKKA